MGLQNIVPIFFSSFLLLLRLLLAESPQLLSLSRNCSFFPEESCLTEGHPTFPGAVYSGNWLSSFIWGATTKHHGPGGLRTTETHLSQFWRLEVEGQGASTVGFWWRFSLGCRWSPSHFILTCQKESKRDFWGLFYKSHS